ncbi:hypothetical protein [Saccharothrix lopnurensis]|uniref:Uncharacterized protein n=1 Tax=Saccharothrix lopnurensis TaxID=1670621 RepID=A0ABW1PH97_9PSEU
MTDSLTPAHNTAVLVPSDRPVDFHGLSREYVHPDRRFVHVPDRTWPAEQPEVCTWESPPGTWFDHHGHPVDSDRSDTDAGVFLLCPGCGLDAT